MTKMRFLKGSKFGRKPYLDGMDGHASLQVLKTRLNMLPIYKNYKADLSLSKMCPYCLEEEDGTEHLVECSKLGRTMLKGDDIADIGNGQLWRQLNERITFNLQNRNGKEQSKNR